MDKYLCHNAAQAQIRAYVRHKIPHTTKIRYTTVQLIAIILTGIGFVTGNLCVIEMRRQSIKWRYFYGDVFALKMINQVRAH